MGRHDIIGKGPRGALQAGTMADLDDGVGLFPTRLREVQHPLGRGAAEHGLAHPLYRIDGRDLYIDLPLTPWEAVLGAAVHIPTLGGTVELNVKPGTSAGQKLRLAKRGLPTTDGSVGALYAVIRIEVPTTPDATERELFQQLAATSKFNPRQYFASGANS